MSTAVNWPTTLIEGAFSLSSVVFGIALSSVIKAKTMRTRAQIGSVALAAFSALLVGLGLAFVFFGDLTTVRIMMAGALLLACAAFVIRGPNEPPGRLEIFLFCGNADVLLLLVVMLRG